MGLLDPRSGMVTMKPWERDLLDHLVFLVINNAERPMSEDEVRDELKRELTRPRDRDAITPGQG
jgi:hypothetical protein